MTELQAERGEGLSAPPIEVKSKRLRYIDLRDRDRRLCRAGEPAVPVQQQGAA